MVGEFHALEAAMRPGIVIGGHAVFVVLIRVPEPGLEVRLAEQGSAIAMVGKVMGDSARVFRQETPFIHTPWVATCWPVMIVARAGMQTTF
ncbi:MAG: hypothetical protein U5O39_07925 [Gammaproteobacteria bacterium]|nr:hypothetical protein [Gammaproteobacteria bacterium]